LAEDATEARLVTAELVVPLVGDDRAGGLAIGVDAGERTAERAPRKSASPSSKTTAL